MLKKINESYVKYKGQVVMKGSSIAVEEHHIIPRNSKYTEKYLRYTKKFGIDTSDKLRKWGKNQRFLYPHIGRHPEEYHKYIDFKLKELSNKANTIEEFEEGLNKIAKEIIEDPVGKGLVSEKTIKKNLKEFKIEK